MPFWVAVVVFFAAVAAIVLLACKISNKIAKAAGIVIASLLGAASLLYILLTLILVCAVD